jgi:crotonobetainyl-CoA:carnitine CoA-transferase CaiB-like acyl-CoA transferase
MPVDKRPRVVDFSTHMSGPTASQLLVQMGADVIKVENPRPGLGHRSMPPIFNGYGVVHYALGAGTRSLAYDRRSPHWSRVVAASAKWADVVLVGARPSDAKSRGIDYETLVQSNPQLVYCLLSGFGEEGPWRDFPAHGLNMDASSGHLPVVWDGNVGTLQHSYLPVGTTAAGAFGALGIMAALYKRDLTGQPQFVDLSIWGSAMWWNWRNLATYANLNQAWSPWEDLGARYCVYRTKDGRAMMIAAAERKFWVELCEILDLPADWKDRGTWENGRDAGKEWETEEKSAISKRFIERSLDEWMDVFSQANVPFSPVLEFQDALESDHARLTGVMTSTTLGEDIIPIPASPIRFRSSHEDTSSLPPPPELGEQTREILRELDLADLIED